MTISMYSASVPVFVRLLTNLMGFLEKAEAYAAERKIDPDVLVNARLAPDMYPLKRQVQIATDHAKGCCSRLAGRPVPSWPDEESNFAELKARVQKALDLLGTFAMSDIDGSEEREIALKSRGEEITMQGLPYLLDRAMPNVYFHVTIAYAILRHSGVPLGKSDYVA